MESMEIAFIVAAAAVLVLAGIIWIAARLWDHIVLSVSIALAQILDTLSLEKDEDRTDR